MPTQVPGLARPAEGKEPKKRATIVDAWRRMTKSVGKMPTEQAFIHAAAVNCQEVLSDGPQDCMFHYVSFNATAGLVISSETAPEQRFAQSTLREFERHAAHIRQALIARAQPVSRPMLPPFGEQQTGRVRRRKK